VFLLRFLTGGWEGWGSPLESPSTAATARAEKGRFRSTFCSIIRSSKPAPLYSEVLGDFDTLTSLTT
jgi:hypothetical protein